jgi:hypothetical protein
MKNKVLICHSDQSKVVGQAIQTVLQLADVDKKDVMLVDHRESLAEFLSGDFTHVIVLDYSERETKNVGGYASWRDISASAAGQKIVRVGFERYEYPDYWMMPFELPELFQKLGLT